jgi:hypothetical protein
MFTRRFSNLYSTQHARNFFHTLFAIQRGDVAQCDSIFHRFAHLPLLVGGGCDLRQVRNAQHLIGLPQFFQQMSDDFRDASADAAIYLVGTLATCEVAT